MKQKLPVTQPFMPPLEEFVPYLEKIWESKWLTNAGQFHQRLESELAAYLGVRHLSLFNNATIALVTALQCLRITGEVITTPYSFVATAHSLLWNNIRPVFVDIDPVTLDLDASLLEPAISSATTAIMPVHCYGTPCDMAGIQRVADIYGLRVIYDAAHAFGVREDGASVLEHGDMSILSFHATKVFNTFEGGAIICPDAKTKQRIDYLKNFGFADEVTVVAPGINGKMNEVQAAFGLLQLRYVDQAIEARSRVDARYREGLAGVPGIRLVPPPERASRNYSYFPLLVQPEYGMSRDELYERLRQHDILARRYFYPLISEMPMYRGMPSAARENLPVATRVAREILCLPIYPDLAPQDQDRVIDILRNGR
jgi:dTDP-4-amino-4,6-dideoxy-D-glucose transaminase